MILTLIRRLLRLHSYSMPAPRPITTHTTSADDANAESARLLSEIAVWQALGRQRRADALERQRQAAKAGVIPRDSRGHFMRRDDR